VNKRPSASPFLNSDLSTSPQPSAHTTPYERQRLDVIASGGFLQPNSQKEPYGWKDSAEEGKALLTTRVGPHLLLCVKNRS